MILYIILGVLVILVAIIVSLYIISKNKFQTRNIKIEEALNQIKSLLNDKYELLNKIDKIVAKKTKEAFLANIEEIKVEELSVFELQSALDKYDMDIVELAEFNKDVKLDNKELEELDKLTKTSIDCTAVEKYYNDNVEIYNKLISSFPYSMMAKICHYKKKESFEVQKEEMFEILKK